MLAPRGHALAFLICSIVLTSTGMLSADQITSTCRITAVDAAQRKVTLFRKTTAGEREGIAKVAADAVIKVNGEPISLDKVAVPLEGVVIYDTERRTITTITAVKAELSMSANAPPRAIAPFDTKKAKQHQEVWAKHVGATIEETSVTGVKMVLIPPSECVIGSKPDEVDWATEEGKKNKEKGWYFLWRPKEGRRHGAVLTKPFYMAAHETTVGLFRRFVEETDYKTDGEKDGKGAGVVDPTTKKWATKPESTWRHPGFPQTDEHPVADVSWNDAVAFCQWLSQKEGKSYRLPTLVEWECACRAGSTTRWCFGDDVATLDAFAWHGHNSGSQTHPVGRKQANAWGLYDMHGNVWEWCADFDDNVYYGEFPLVDPVGTSSGAGRINRGGSWLDLPNNVRSASRDTNGPQGRVYNVGFRVARDL